tara:strand:- start:1212 stop:1703 length:492 start_codon:yes stop_codon:yes gene_type:complete
MTNLAPSLFSLIKTNGGLFKSKKQAKFLLSHCVNGTYLYNSVAKFGKSRANQHRVTYKFYLADTHVEKVEKYTDKAVCVVMFQFKDAEQAKLDIQTYQAKQAECDLFNSLTKELKHLNALLIERKDALLERLLITDSDDIESLSEYKAIQWIKGRISFINNQL